MSSRSGLISSNDCDHWSYIRWRGAVASAIKGKRGQAFIRELKEALEAMPAKRLIKDELINAEGEVCAVASVMKARGLDASSVHVDDYDRIAELLGVNAKLIQEIEWENDHARKFYVLPYTGYAYQAKTHYDESPEQRWKELHGWCEANLI
jgi:hypothetical protein